MACLRCLIPERMPRTFLFALLLAMLGFVAQPIEPVHAWALDCTDPANLTAMMIDQPQCESLESFYDNLGGAGWWSNYGWGTATDVDSWRGLARSGGNVTEIIINVDLLTGNIDDVDLTGLTGLERIRLYDNQIGGSIDGLDLTGLSNLEELTLHVNQIGGDIGNWNLSGMGLTSLRLVFLSNNQIGGDIGNLDLSGLNALEAFTVNNNQIVGDPSEITGIPASLNVLRIEFNQMNGTVPDLTGTDVDTPPGFIRLCPNPAINPTGNPTIDNFAEAYDEVISGWTAASGCGITNLVTSATCNGSDLDVTLTTGDGPFDITGTGGPDLPQNGVHIGITTLIGPGSWTGVTVTETTDDLQSINLGDFTCPVPNLAATAACNGPNLNVTITAGDPNFDISADDPAPANQAQNNVPTGTYTLTSSGSYGTWTNITIDELGGDTETLNLPDVTCNPSAPGGGGDGGSSGAAQVQAPGCNVTIDVEADHEVVTPGDRVIWMVLIRNPGPDDCQGVQTYGTMPGEFVITDITPSWGTLNWDGGQYYLVELGTLAVGDQVTVSLDSLLQGGAGLILPEGAAGQSAGQSICLTGYITDPVNDTDCVTLFPDTLPSTGGQPISQSQNWGWLAAAGILIVGLSGYAIRRRVA